PEDLLDMQSMMNGKLGECSIDEKDVSCARGSASNSKNKIMIGTISPNTHFSATHEISMGDMLTIDALIENFKAEHPDIPVPEYLQDMSEKAHAHSCGWMHMVRFVDRRLEEVRRFNKRKGGDSPY